MTIDQIITLIGLILTFIGTFGGGIFIALITSGYFKKNKKEEDEKINNNIFTCSNDPLELCNDYVFIKLDNLHRDINTHFKMENKGKEFILKLVMGIKISAYRDELYDLCINIDKKLRNGIIITEEELFKMNMEMFDRAYIKYTEFYKNNPLFTDDEVKALDIFMDKFNIWHEKTVVSTLTSITESCRNKYIQDIRMKQSMINIHFSSAFASTITDLENTADSINGDLAGLKFKDVVI